MRLSEQVVSIMARRKLFRVPMPEESPRANSGGFCVSKLLMS